MGHTRVDGPDRSTERPVTRPARDSGKSNGQRDREVARHRVVTQAFCQNVAGSGFVEFLSRASTGSFTGAER